MIYFSSLIILLVKSLVHQNRYLFFFCLFKNLLFTSIAIFAIYPDITRIKRVNGNEIPQGAFNLHHYVTLNEDNPNSGIFRKWHEKDDALSIRGIRPIVLHALNEWKRASLIQGRLDVPNSQFYWGPHGLVKRSVENEDESKNSIEGDNEDADVRSIPRYSQENGYRGEYGEHTFEVIPTIILNIDDYSSPYQTYGTPYAPCNYKTLESYDRFGTIKGNLQNWQNNPKYVNSKSQIYRSSEPRDPTLHSHGHSHFHQHVHSHGLNVLRPQTQLHSGAGFVHNAGLVTNVPISSTIPQTHITNINIPQQHSTGFTSHLNGGFTSGLNHGSSGFSSHQTAVNVGHGSSGITSGLNHGSSGFSSHETAVNVAHGSSGITSGLNHGSSGFSAHETAVNVGHGSSGITGGLNHGSSGFSSHQTAVNVGHGSSGITSALNHGSSGFSSHQTAVNVGHGSSGITSGLNHGSSGFSSHQAAVNIGHGGVGGFGTTSGNVQIAQVSGANNAVSQSSFREAGEESLGSPSIFQFPLNSRRVSFDRSSSQEGHNQRSFQRNKRSLFPLEVVSKILTAIADDNVKVNERPKRSLPLVKLAVDPNAKLDVFQTSDNMGKLIKSSLDDERSPVSHLKDMTGSLRDTFISSTRLIPSDVIIPARYKVIDTHQHDIVKIPLSKNSEHTDRENNFVGGINPAVYQQPAVSTSKSGTVSKEPLKNTTLKKSKTLLSKDPEKLSSSDPTSFYKTYQKIGDMIRNTVVSSQQTLSHVNDAISSGRKLAHSTKGAVPRLLLPLSKVPALEKPGSKPYVPVQPDRALLVAPKGSRVNDIVGSSHKHNEDFVSTSNLFDSIGLTHTKDEDENMMEYLVQRSPAQLQKKHLLLANNKGSHVDGALEVLNEAEETVDATNLHDFVIKLKNELERPHVVGEKNVIGAESSSKSCTCSKGRGKVRTNEVQLKMQENERMENKIYQNTEEVLEDPIVESSFVTRKDLLKPFMGRIKLEDLHKLLNDSRRSNEENKIKSSVSSKRAANREFNVRSKRSAEGDDEPMLGAINPNLFQEYFNEPLQDIKNFHRDPFKEPADQIRQQSRQSSNDTELEMNHSKFLLKPFVAYSKSSEETRRILEKFGYKDKTDVNDRKKALPKIYEIVSLSS
ncbi:uncharacterized protein LOC112906686 [Agrilus planipennis]|uniref:Uncharacterized protein LOC112906686 n=1 Tax=Agrilus planipennis TaxID=224129 RepID=A0A7F5RM38_AGRPL|nr:uncharacterized protein LOC112906686 [Agrilus planipennis]